MSSLRIPLVGAFYRPPAKSILQASPSGMRLYLIPEPQNEYDQNAIAVNIRVSELPADRMEVLRDLLPSQGFEWEEIAQIDSVHVGYVKKEWAAEIKQGGWPIGAARLDYSADGKPQIVMEIKND